MGRKNHRNKRDYYRGLGFDPNKYITKNTHIARNTPIDNRCELFTEDCSYGSRKTPDTYHADPKPKEPQRRDLWYANLGNHSSDPHDTSCVQDGLRPVFVISTDKANKNSTTITVVPLTTKYKKPNLPSHVWLENGYCIRNGEKEDLGPSMVLGEQITTIDKSSLRCYIGRVQDREVVALIERAVMSYLNLLPKKQLETKESTDIALQDTDTLESTNNNKGVC